MGLVCNQVVLIVCAYLAIHIMEGDMQRSRAHNIMRMRIIGGGAGLVAIRWDVHSEAKVR